MGFKVSDDGTTMETLKETVNSGRPTIQFGEFLYHRYGDEFEVTFRLDDGGNSGLLIGFITPRFTEFERKHTDFACLAAGNGWFKIDTKCGFKCEEAKNLSSGPLKYMQKNGQTLKVSVNMQTKMGKIGIYNITLPDVVGIALCSNTGHKITAIE